MSFLPGEVEKIGKQGFEEFDDEGNEDGHGVSLRDE
jgi:hypothetical protein